MCVNRLEVKGGELGKEAVRRETGSLGAGSDCASTRGMAGSITSSYTIPDRYAVTHAHIHKHSLTIIMLPGNRYAHARTYSHACTVVILSEALV